MKLSLKELEEIRSWLPNIPHQSHLISKLDLEITKKKAKKRIKKHLAFQESIKNCCDLFSKGFIEGRTKPPNFSNNDRTSLNKLIANIPEIHSVDVKTSFCGERETELKIKTDGLSKKDIERIFCFRNNNKGRFVLIFE